MKRHVRSIAVLGSLALCTAVVGGTAAAAEAPEAIHEAPATEAHSSDPHGAVQLIGEALSDVCLEPQQREQLANLGTQVESGLAGMEAARNGMMLALADQMEAGKIDRCALQPQIDALVSAREAASPTFRHGLGQLHQILTPEQRTEFVDALTARIKTREDMSIRGQWLDEFAKDVGLSDEQKTEIRALMEKGAPGVKADIEKGKAVLEAFRGDSFDLEKLLPSSEIPTKAAARAEKMVDMAEAIASILTPEQRRLAGAKIREKIAPTAEKVGAADEGASLEEPVGTSEEAIVWGGRAVAGGRVGGFGYRRGYAARGVAVSTRRYGVGYPYARGFGPGFW